MATGVTPQNGGAVSNNSNNSSVEVDALLALVSEVTALKREMGFQAETIQAQSEELALLRKKCQDVEGNQRSTRDSNSDGPLDTEAVIDDQGHVHAGRDVYKFGESVWDATILVGYVEGALASIDMVFLAVLNVGIQAYFCALLFNLDMVDTENVIEQDIHDFVQWRVGVAHQAQSYDVLTQSSLAQRVCQEYGGTIASRSQQSDFERFDLYLDGKTTSELQGPGLLMLALALWIALILKEIVAIFGFIRMLAAVSTNGANKTVVAKHEDGSIELVSMSRCRAIVMFWLVAIPRTAIAGLLGVTGVYFLRREFGIEEIILNTVALGFVLEIDELLFAFAPSAARYAVSNMADVPIELQRKKDENPASCRSLLRALLERSRVLLVLLVGIVILCRLTLIQQVEDSMKLAQVILCDGNLDFVFQQNPATHVLVVGRTIDIPNNVDIQLDKDRLGHVFDGVLQATGLCDMFDDDSLEFKDIIDKLRLCRGDKPQLWCDTCKELLDDSYSRSQTLPVDEASAMVSMTTSDVLESMPCADVYTSVEQRHIKVPFEEMLLAANFTGTLSICSEMQQYCLDDNIQVREIVRRFCSVECKCDHGLQATIDGTAWFLDRVGCLPACDATMETELSDFQQRLLIGAEDCEDRDYLLVREDWEHLVHEVEELLIQRGKLHVTVTASGEMFKYADEETAEVFKSFTNNDFQDFRENILHSSNSVDMIGCDFQPNVSIEILSWAEALDGQVCRWAAIVMYVFNLDFCISSNLRSGLTPLLGLCPVTCQVGVCASNIYQDSNLNVPGTSVAAWYNVLSYWGQEALFNISCDSSNFHCIQVDKFQAQDSLDWHGYTLTIDEQIPGQNATTLFSTEATAGVAWAVDLFCTRMQEFTAAGGSATDVNSTNSSSASSSSEVCFTITASKNGIDQGPGPAHRWRLTDMYGNVIITAGWERSYDLCGYDWRSEFGTVCALDASVAVLDTWVDMQTFYNDLHGGDASRPSLAGAARGMFAIKKAGILGGYDPESDTIEVAWYVATMGNKARIPLGLVAYPVPSDGTTAQDYVACKAGPEATHPGEVDTAPLCNGTLTCTGLVSAVSCASTIEMVAVFAAQDPACMEVGLSSDVILSDTFTTLCPSQCEIQLDQQVCTQSLVSTADQQDQQQTGPSLMQQYSEYYSFTDPHCLISDCDCLTPWHIMQGCAGEFFTGGEHPLQDAQLLRNLPTPTWSVENESTALLANLLMNRTTACFWEEEGLATARTPVSLSGPWCLVRASCPTSFPTESSPGCAWRAALEADCQLQPEYSDEVSSYSWAVFPETTTTTPPAGPPQGPPR
mmetsp:Transcript_27409/g.64010  ORF Transcript_27409/g.64010 Transcript_27409/m.64010 type:complete len:1319 (+) Transcript_27409:100-4056(+)